MDEIISVAARQIAQAIRAELANGESRGGAKGRPRGAQPRSYPAHCVYPGCKRPHKGPRFSFLCEQHLNASKADKKKYLAAWKAENAPKAKAKTKGKRGAAKGNGRRGRRSSLNEATLARVLKVVQSSPGLRSEEIMKKVPIAPNAVKAALAKLRTDRRVKASGQARGTTYSAS